LGQQLAGKSGMLHTRLIDAQQEGAMKLESATGRTTKLTLAALVSGVIGCVPRANVVADKPNSAEYARAPDRENDAITGDLGVNVDNDGITTRQASRRKKTEPAPAADVAPAPVIPLAPPPLLPVTTVVDTGAQP
jgi:hypothetical protein